MDKKNSVQFWAGAVVIAAGLVLLFLGALMPPGGEIHPSLLIGFGEVATFAGALMGVDYHYKFRIHELEEETRRLKNE
jgi:hypothetical protein